MRLVDLFRMPAQVTEDGRKVHDGMDRYLYHPVGLVVISLLSWARAGRGCSPNPGCGARCSRWSSGAPGIIWAA